VIKNDEPVRCGWVTSDPIYVQYHDTEWGVEISDDRLLFEHLCLEVNQAGLSWLTVLKKRPRYRQLFYDFDVERVSRMQSRSVDRLLPDGGIIRNRKKIEAMIHNAKCFRKLQREFGSFYDYSWQFLPQGRTSNRWRTLEEIPSQTEASRAMSQDLKQRGFRFVGPTTIYAHMQAVGMVNDHLVNCFRYQEVR